MAIFTFIGATIGAALFGAGTLAASIAGSVISGGLMIGARLALSYRNRPKKTLSTAVQGQVQLGGDVAVQVLFGIGKTKGHRIHYAKYGGGNAVNAGVFVLANGRCAGLEPYIYFYGEKHDLISQTPVGNEHARYTVDGYGSSIIIRFYDGRPGQLADSELVTATSGLGNPWKVTSTVAAHAYVVVERTWSASLFDKGRPEFEFVLRGNCWWDPRFDSTMPGGEGDQRLVDPSTWAFTQNPAIHRLNFQLGLRGLLSGDVLVGVGKSINQIDVTMHMVAANVCDAERNVGGRTIPTYHNNLFVSAEDDHIAVLQMMEDAMAGYAVNRAGLDGVLAGAPQVPVLEITDADIRADAPRKSKNRRSGFDSVNILSGQFTSIEAHWNPESLNTVSVNADIATDGRKRPAGNDFLQITDPDIGQYLLNIRYRQNRKARQRTLPVSRKVGARLQPGNWVTYDGSDWLVTRWGFDKQFQFTLELAETGEDVYDEEGITAGPVVAPPLTPANPSLISAVANFGVAAGLIEGDNGSQVPSLQFTWDDPDDPTVVTVRIEYRRAGTTTPVITAAASDVSGGALVVTEAILSGLNYEARATITTQPDRLRTWTSWVSTSSPTPSIQLILNEVAEDVQATLTGMRSDLDDYIARLSDIGTSLSLSGLANYNTIGVIGERVGQAEASITTEQEVRASADDAIAAQLITFDASLGATNAALANEALTRATADSAIAADVTTLSSAITTETANRVAGDASNASSISTVAADLATEQSTRATADSANASSITALNADFDGRFASGLVKFAAQAAPGGVDARFAVMLRAGTGDAFKYAGFHLDLKTVLGEQVSEFVVDADRFVVTDGTDSGSPLVFDDGELKLNAARIGTVVFDQLSSANGKLVIKGSGSNASIEVFS